MPVRLRDLWQAAAPFVGRTPDRAALDRVFFQAGLFVTWPWGLTTASDTSEALGLRRNLAIQPAPANPLPQVIPDAAWAHETISMVDLVAWWAAAPVRACGERSVGRGYFPFCTLQLGDLGHPLPGGQQLPSALALPLLRRGQ